MRDSISFPEDMRCAGCAGREAVAMLKEVETNIRELFFSGSRPGIIVSQWVKEGTPWFRRYVGVPCWNDECNE